MDPKGRSRKGNTRLDAALDYMQMFGFSEQLVRDTVENLLKVYGGDDGWIFIEGDSYKILREALLESTQGKRRDDSVRAHSEMSSVANPTQNRNATYSKAPAAVFGDSSKQIDLGVGGTNLQGAMPSTQNKDKLAEGSARNQSSQMMDRVPVRRKYCYGWISDDDDEKEEEKLDLVELEPAVLPKELEDMIQGYEKKEKRRKSRWDLKPGDP